MIITSWCCNHLRLRDWNDELTGKLPAKRPLLFVLSSECGKPTSAANCWSAYKMPDCFGKSGRHGRSAFGTRKSSKVWLPINYILPYSQILGCLDAALSFAQRCQIHVSSSALQVWHKRLATQQGANAFAVQYAHAQLQFRILYRWRVQLRAHLKRFRQAKIADKFFVMRQAWKIWVDKAEERGRQKRLREWNKGRAEKVFAGTSEQ